MKFKQYINEEKSKTVIIQAILDKSKELGVTLKPDTIKMLFKKNISNLEILSKQLNSDKGKELVKTFSLNEAYKKVIAGKWYLDYDKKTGKKSIFKVEAQDVDFLNNKLIKKEITLFGPFSSSKSAELEKDKTLKEMDSSTFPSTTEQPETIANNILATLDDGSHLPKSSNCPKCGSHNKDKVKVGDGSNRYRCQECSNLYLIKESAKLEKVNVEIYDDTEGKKTRFSINIYDDKNKSLKRSSDFLDDDEALTYCKNWAKEHNKIIDKVNRIS